MQLTPEQIEELRKPEGCCMTRALRWITWVTPMQVGVEYRVSAVTAKGRRKVVGYIQLLKRRLPEYWQFLKDNGIEPTIYDKTLGNYQLWCAQAK